MNYINFREIFGRNGTQPHHECPFPVSSEAIANTLIEFADRRKLNIVSQAIRNRGIIINLEEYDNWDGGIWTWLISILLSPSDWALFNSKEERIAVENELSELINCCLNFEEHNSRVQFEVIPPSSHKIITNQGRAHSANPAAIEYEGFFFRSHPEVFLFVALRNMGIPVMPLPVVASNRPYFKRIEPDFIVIKRGLTFVVEVDGNRWHQETPAAAQERLSHLEEEGVRVIRVSASNCNSNESARETANKILIKIERMLESR